MDNFQLVRSAWYPVAFSKDVGQSPCRAELFGMPIVLFRPKNQGVSVLEDRCPHRGVPLSKGRLIDGELECIYHGWRFDGTGRCTSIPAAAEFSVGEKYCASRYPVCERSGIVFVWGAPECEPTGDPMTLENPEHYFQHRLVFDFDAPLVDVAENALDVPHTAYLHRGLFRQASELKAVDVEVHRDAESVSAEYIGESLPRGWIARLLAPGATRVEHWDRFFRPGITQVEYRIGDRNHLLLSGYLSPLDTNRTRMFAKAALKTRVPLRAMSKIVMPMVNRLLEQDADILRAQVTNRRCFEGRHELSSPADVLSVGIRALLRNQGAQRKVHKKLKILV